MESKLKNLQQIYPRYAPSQRSKLQQNSFKIYPLSSRNLINLYGVPGTVSIANISNCQYNYFQTSLEHTNGYIPYFGSNKYW